MCFATRRSASLAESYYEAIPNGHCHISSEVVGDPDDPMTQQRKDVFAPLSEQITGVLESTLGPVELDDHPAPPSQKSPQEIVECEYTPCERCGETAALLIYAHDATDPGRFEDYARKMYHEYKRLDVPTWIIGPPLGVAGFETPSDILKVWPTRESIRRLTPNEFNADLDSLLKRYC